LIGTRLISWRAAAIFATFGGVACDGCRDTPSVPFAMDGSAAPSSSAAPSAPSSPGFPEEASEPPDPGKIVLDGRSIDAPEGRTFAAVLRGDGDADGVEDAFVWAKDASGGGELLFYAGKERGESKAVLHVEKARPGCPASAHLRRVGRETLTLDVTSTCTGDAGARETAKIVVVHLPEGRAHGALPEARLVVEKKASPTGERLELSLVAEDRDGDGREDLVIRAKLEGAAAPMPAGGSAEASFVAIDRPAGYTLDPSEPEAGLERAAAELVRKAARKDDAPAIAPAVASLVRLQAALCGDLGAAVVSTTAGAVTCGDGKASIDALVADATAAITLKDLPRAFATAELVATVGDRKSAHAKKLTRDLDKLAPTTGVRVLARVPTEGDPSPLATAPPFTFDIEGRLVVMRGTEVVRVGAEGAALPTDAVPWPRAIAWVSGGSSVSLAGVTRRCGPSSLVATLDRGGARTEVTLPDASALLAPGLGTELCTAGRVDVGALSLGAGRALFTRGGDVFVLTADGDAIVATRGGPVETTDAPGPPGGARSADGKTSVHLVGRDALVVGPSGAKRWRAPEIAAASACTPRASGDQLACAGARGVVLLEAAR
jgi:hypothetical protein